MKQDDGLVPTGANARSYSAKKSWATRRMKYGPYGLTEDVRNRVSQITKERIRRDGHHMSNKTRCLRGHLFTPENTIIRRSGARECRACQKFRQRAGRPEWVTIKHVKVNLKIHDAYYLYMHARLRVAMINAHPDKGRNRSTEAFLKAKRQLEQFLKREKQWYVIAQMTLPKVLAVSSRG